MGLPQQELYICEQLPDEALEDEQMIPDEADFEVLEPHEAAMILYLIIYAQDSDFDMEFIA